MTWNPGVEAVLGYSREQFIGTSVAMLFVEEDRRADVPGREIARAEQFGEASDDRWHLRQGGSRIFVAGMVTPLYDENGQLEGFFKLIRDRTEAVESSARLRERGDRAEAANREKDAHVALMAHELRQPLNAILGWATMGARSDLPQERATEIFRRIVRSAESTVRFVHDLLEVSRISAGKLELAMEPANLATLAGEAVTDARPDAEARQIAITTRIPSECVVTGDAVRLRQVIGNLLGNAVKYTHPGGAVRVVLEREDDQATLTVSDTGVGIASQDLPHIFDRFRQSREASERQSGLGLGLWVVRELVRRHGGTVHVASEGPGKGATFTVRIPTRHEQASIPLVAATVSAAPMTRSE